jgi:hypothetical protein
VSFQEVTVYEFPVRLGDNPACSSGCPITMANKHKSVTTQRLDDDDFDSSGNNSRFLNSKERESRRSSKELVIPPEIRTKMLIRQGYELEKIVKRTEDVLKIQEQRRESMNKTFGEGMKEFFGPATKGLKLATGQLKLNRQTAKSA